MHFRPNQASMKGSAAELASVVSRALLVASNQTTPSRAWTPSLEKTLHQLGCRDSLNPTLVARVIDPFLLNHHSLAFGFFNWAAQQPGFSHTSATYQSVIKSLSLSRQFHSIDKLLKQLRSQRLFLHPTIYSSIIRSLVSGRRTHSAFAVFHDVVSIAGEIGPEVCNSLLAALASDGNISGAHKVFDEMMKRGIRFTTLGFGVFLRWACRKKELHEILSLIDDVRTIDSSGINGSVVALLVVHGLCMERRAEDAMFALEGLRQRDCKPDFMAYRIVSETLREMGNIAEVQIVLKRKRKLGVAPRASDYREFILQLVTEKHILEAKELGDVITNGDFPIEDDVLNVLIGSVSPYNSSHSITFLKFMLDKQRLPTLLTVINLSENLCKLEKGEELVEIFTLLSTKDYFKELESYHVMVSYLCKASRVKEAYEVLREMKKKGLKPDISSYNSVLEALCRLDLLRPAKRLWDEMFANGCCPNSDGYSILIEKLSEVDQVEDAHNLFNQMLERGLRPNGSVYESLVRGLCRVKNLEMAREIFDKCIEQDREVARELLGPFVVCLCKEGFLVEASKLLCGMKCVESHLNFLRYLSDAGKSLLASQYLQLIEEESPEVVESIRQEFVASLSSS